MWASESAYLEVNPGSATWGRQLNFLSLSFLFCRRALVVIILILQLTMINLMVLWITKEGYMWKVSTTLSTEKPLGIEVEAIDQFCASLHTRRAPKSRALCLGAVGVQAPLTRPFNQSSVSASLIFLVFSDLFTVPGTILLRSECVLYC